MGKMGLGLGWREPSLDKYLDGERDEWKNEIGCELMVRALRRSVAEK